MTAMYEAFRTRILRMIDICIDLSLLVLCQISQFQSGGVQVRYEWAGMFPPFVSLCMLSTVSHSLCDIYRVVFVQSVTK